MLACALAIKFLIAAQYMGGHSLLTRFTKSHLVCEIPAESCVMSSEVDDIIAGSFANHNRDHPVCPQRHLLVSQSNSRGLAARVSIRDR